MLFQRYLVVLRRLTIRWKACQKSLYSTSAVTDSDVTDSAVTDLCVTDPDVVLNRVSTASGTQEEPGQGDQRVLRAAILGVPNAGKTTLVNQLLGQKLFAVSPKRHTTTRSTVGVFTQGNSQVILMDTPGVIPYQVGRKLRAPKSFLTGPQRSLMEAELVMVVVDASDKKTRHQLDQELMHILTRHCHVPAILLLNKVDVVRHKHMLLHVTESLTGAAKKWMQEERQKREERKQTRTHDQEAEKLATTSVEVPHMDRPETPGSFSASRQAQFSISTGAGVVHQSQEKASQSTPIATFQEVFMVSALTGDGVDAVREYLVSCACPGLWEYSVAVQSDQSQLELVEDIVREKLFLHLHREIPYVVTQNNVIWEKEGDTQIIYQNLTCRSSSQASIVIGPAGRTVGAITAEAREDIEALLGCPVDLTLNVKTRK